MFIFVLVDYREGGVDALISGPFWVFLRLWKWSSVALKASEHKFFLVNRKSGFQLPIKLTKKKKRKLRIVHLHVSNTRGTHARHFSQT